MVPSTVISDVDWEEARAAVQMLEAAGALVIAQEVIQPDPSRHIPRCPTCGSSRVRLVTGKIGTAALVGIFALPKMAKTFECLNCRYRW
jgi:hypothetical protein